MWRNALVVLAGFTLVVWRKAPVIEDGVAVWICFVRSVVKDKASSSADDEV